MDFKLNLSKIIEKRKQIEKPKGELIKVLCVDDEPGNLHILKSFFKNDYDIYTALNADEGLELVREHDFYVIISDQRMPKVLGTKFLGMAKEIRPYAMRIILTGYSDVEDIIDSINSGEVYRYILKPWDRDEMRTTVKSAVEKAVILRDKDSIVDRLKEEKKNLETKVEEKDKKVIEYSNLLKKVMSQTVPEELLEEAVYREYGYQKLNISFMFVDMAGADEYYKEVKDPEILGKHFQEYHTMLFDCIQENHLGRHVAETGNGCFAVFGTPFESQTHRVDAILAAMQILYRYTNDYSDNANKAKYPGKGLQIGIHAGDAVVGDLGPTQKIGYNVLGPAIRLASRIDKKAPVNQIVVTEEIQIKIKHLFYTESIGSFTIDEMDNVSLYTIKGLKNVLENPTRVLPGAKIHSKLKEIADQNLEDKISEFQKNIFPGIDFLKMESLDGGILHLRGTALFAVALANEMGLLKSINLDDFICASLLHDCGKKYITRKVLLKSYSKMLDEERKLIESLASYTIQIAQSTGTNDMVEEIVKRFYQLNQKFSSISFKLDWEWLSPDPIKDSLAECLAIADCYDALTNLKFYKSDKGLQSEKALDLIKKTRDSEAVDRFIELLKE